MYNKKRKKMKVLRVLGGIMMFSLAFHFVEWFIKGLFGKYFIIFWIWLIAAIAYCWAYNDPEIRFNNHWPQHPSVLSK